MTSFVINADAKFSMPVLTPRENSVVSLILAMNINMKLLDILRRKIRNRMQTIDDEETGMRSVQAMIRFSHTKIGNFHLKVELQPT